MGSFGPPKKLIKMYFGQIADEQFILLNKQGKKVCKVFAFARGEAVEANCF